MSLTAEDTVFCSVPVAHLPLFEILEPIREAGFSALSIAVSHLLDLEAQGVGLAQVRGRIADAGLQVAEVDCVGFWLPEQAGASSPYGDVLRRLTPDRVIDYAAQLGARSVSAVELFDVPVDLDVAAERFAGICERAGACGLLAAIEFIPVGGIPDLRTAAEIVRRAGAANGGLMVDAFHLFRSGSSLADLAALPPAQVVSVQVCDAPAQPQGELAEEMVTRRLLPGEGGLDVAGMLRTLRRMGCQAPIGVEVFDSATGTQPIETTARRWRDALARVMRDAAEDTEGSLG
jgi:sugar phosphate isomerase/epimerase